jgi:hypothetical protein
VRSAQQLGHRRVTLPSPQAKYVPRPEEEARLAAALLGDARRCIVVLCGPGGMVSRAFDGARTLARTHA